MKVCMIFFLILPGILLAETIPQTVLLRGEHLASYKKLIKTDKLYKKAWESLRKRANKYIGKAPYTVLNKRLTADSGDKHDYMSFGPYWWPNPKTENGLPYIRKDGLVNPEARDDRGDHQQFGRLLRELQHLSVSYYFSQDEKYAERGALLINTWFLNPKTKMNPNLNYAQAIPGRTKGRGIGIIETRYLGKVVDALVLFKDSKHFDTKLISDTKTWLNTYLDWLLTSENGHDESNAKNNHGTWYDVQVATLALYCDRQEVLQKVIKRVQDKRFKQIADDGSQPHELSRTKTFEYSKMNLEAFLYLARFSEFSSIDLWSANNQKILSAALFIVNLTDKQWPYKQIRKYDYAELYGAMKMASVYKNEKIEQFVKKIKAKAGIDLLLY